MCLGGINTYTRTHFFFSLSLFICCSSKMIRTKHIFLHFVFILLRSNFSIYSIFYRRPNKIFVFALNSFIFHCSHSLCGCWGEWNMAEFRIRGRTKNMDVALEIRLHPNWAAVRGPFCLHILYTLSLNTRCAHRVIVVKHQMTFQTLHSVSYGTYRPVMFASYMQKPQV